MNKHYSANIILFLYLGDMVLTQLAMQLARLARLYWPIAGAPAFSRVIPLKLEVYLLVACTWTLAFMALSLYDAPKMSRPSDEVIRMGLAISLGALLLAGALYLSFLYRVYLPRLLFAYFMICDGILLLGFRWLTRWLLRKYGHSSFSPQRILIVGTGPLARRLLMRTQVSFWNHPIVAAFAGEDESQLGQHIENIPVAGTWHDIPALIEKFHVDQVILALPNSAYATLEQLVVDLQKLPVDVKFVPEILELAFSTPRVEYLDDIPIIGLREPALSSSTRLVKRLFDLLVTCLLLVFLAPIMLLVAILVKLSSPGPVIFKQVRIGENGYPFTLYKFRTMTADAEARFHQVLTVSESGEYQYKKPDDPRLIPLGKVLRRYSLDETPQFFNVLIGNMSLVGPRPELPFFVDRYTTWQRKRFSVPPGLTGWWQVSGRGELPMHQSVEYDLYYINNYSIFMDIRIFFMTIFTVMSARGAF